MHFTVCERAEPLRQPEMEWIENLVNVMEGGWIPIPWTHTSIHPQKPNLGSPKRCLRIHNKLMSRLPIESTLSLNLQKKWLDSWILHFDYFNTLIIIMFIYCAYVVVQFVTANLIACHTLLRIKTYVTEVVGNN